MSHHTIEFLLSSLIGALASSLSRNLIFQDVQAGYD